MIQLALMLALLPATAAVATHPHVGDKAGCSNGATQMVQDKGKAGFHRLDTLPPANEQLTVIHSVDGCQKPVIVRYGIGGGSKAAPAKP